MHKTRTGHIVEFSVDSDAIAKLTAAKKEMGDKFPKFGVFMLSYNAALFIEKTLSRIPVEAFDLIEEIFIFDDCSPDNTYRVAQAVGKESIWNSKLNIYRNPRNLRYGGNQKVGYRYAIDKGLDYVIMLHADGQYAPEYIPGLMLPAITQQKQVVFASRMIIKKDALKGGMPFYKFVGNQVLTKFENLILGTKLAEFHSGYRMYATDILKKLPLEENTNEFHFDTEIIIQCRHLGIEIKEVPIKTFYGDEECNVNGLAYAWDVVKSVIKYRLHQLHIIRKGSYIVNRDFVYTRKRSPYSSHEVILKQIAKGKRVLDLGSSNGLLFKELSDQGNEIICVDMVDPSQVTIPKENYIQCNLEEYEKLNFSREFDYIILADVVEHLRNAKGLMQYIKKFLKEDGKIIVSVPNIAIFIYRLSLMLGRFNYSEKGTLDETHVRFYTKFSITQLLERSGYTVHANYSTSLPFEVLFESSGKSKLIKLIDNIYYFFAKHWQKMFAYQFVLVASINSLENIDGEGKVN